MTTLEQLKFVKKGLNLKEVFVWVYLKKLKEPTSLNAFLAINPLIGLNERSLRTIIDKLEELNMIAKFKTSTHLIFVFPFLKSKKTHHRIKYKPCKKQPSTTFMCGKKQPLSFTIYNYINNLKNKRKERNVNIKSNITSHYDDDIMSIITNKQINNTYMPPNLQCLNEQKHEVVVSQNNFDFISSIKAKFKKDFPNRKNFLSCPLPDNFNYDLLITKIKESPFLNEKDNLSFSWLVSKYDAIINDCYAPFKERTEQQSFITKEPEIKPSERIYTKEFLNSLFTPLDRLDDIEI